MNDFIGVADGLLGDDACEKIIAYYEEMAAADLEPVLNDLAFDVVGAWTRAN